jgi:DNA-binding HxlR family transcriptional regulator
MSTSTKRTSQSGCPIASTLDIVGDRWTLVILRDMFTGKSKFGDFLSSPERITTNVLTDRLALLKQSGLARKKAYQKRPLRYEYHLTKKGEALLPVLQEICKWANNFKPGTWTPPDSFMNRLID